MRYADISSCKVGFPKSTFHIHGIKYVLVTNIRLCDRCTGQVILNISKRDN